MRIGFGYDAHRLTRGRLLVLGGVKIEHPFGLEGHSDADVLLHALTDALLGAAGLGDIGTHFPADDPEYKDISSLKLLEKTIAMLKDLGYIVVNADSTVVCEAPRLMPFIPAMVEKISFVLGCPRKSVNVKAKTEEGMGFTGKGQGIKAYAVVLIAEKMPAGSATP